MSNTVNNYTETDLGNISLNPRGAYDNSAAYEYLDAVSYQGGSYFCRAELETTITGITPDAGRNSEHWQMIAAPGDMTPEYTAAYNDVIKKVVQVETSRAAVELAQQEIEAVQTDVQQLHSDTVQAAQEVENSKNSAANSAQSAEQSRKTVSESEQNINEQIAGFDSRVSEAVEQSKEEINTTKQQAIDTITNQQNTSVNIVKTEGEKIITRVGGDAKTVANDRATVEEAVQTVLNNAQEVAQNTQIVASNTENAAASAESAKTSADNATQAAKSVEDASKQIEQNKKDVASLKEDKADKTSLAQTDRKLDALWKLNQGISYEFQTDDTEAYQKTVPSGAKVANVKSIGGKTIVWNQLITNARKISFSVKEEQNEGWLKTTNTMCHSEALLIKNHTYIGLLQTDCKNITVMNAAYGEVATGIFTCNNAQRYNKDYDLYVVSSGMNVGEYYFSYMLFDLTQMFGSGNEPSTPEEFEAMFPADYYPYNAGELMSAPVNEVKVCGKNLFNDDASKWHEYGSYFYYPLDESKTYTMSIVDNSYEGSIFSLGFIDDVWSPDSKLTWAINDGRIDYEKITKKGFKYLFLYTKSEDLQTTLNKFKIQLELGSTATAYEPYHEQTVTIPQAILNLPGYGWSARDVRNEVNWENKQYIQKVGKYVITGDEFFITAYMPTIVFNNSSYAIKPGLQTINNRGLNINSTNNSGNDWQFDITDLGLDENATTDDIKEWFKKHPATVYYPMFNEEIIDIFDIIGNTFQEPLEVEAGGTFTFKNSNGDNYRIPVPSSEEYLISLAEVAK